MCYNSWNSSVRVILLPSALLLIEMGNYLFNFASNYFDMHATGGSISNFVKISADHLNPAIYRSGTGLQIQTSLAIFSSLAVTLITSLLILYPHHSHDAGHKLPASPNAKYVQGNRRHDYPILRTVLCSIAHMCCFMVYHIGIDNIKRSPPAPI